MKAGTSTVKPVCTAATTIEVSTPASVIPSAGPPVTSAKMLPNTMLAASMETQETSAKSRITPMIRQVMPRVSFQDWRSAENIRFSRTITALVISSRAPIHSSSPSSTSP